MCGSAGIVVFRGAGAATMKVMAGGVRASRMRILVLGPRAGEEVGVRRAGVVRWSAAGLGFAAGLVIVLTPSASRGAPLWVVWASLAVALTSAAGGVVGYGLARWAELSALLRPVRVRVRDVIVPVAGLLAMAVLAAMTSVVLTLAAHRAGSGWPAVRGWALTAIAAVAAVPAVAVMFGVRYAAGSEAVTGKLGEQAAALIALRRLLARLLAAVGSLVALSTLALGASLALAHHVPAGSDLSRAQLAPQTVLIFGGAGSALLALAYGPASSALRDRGQRLRDELFPLSEADEPAAIVTLAEGRSQLEQLLGMDRTVMGDLQTGLVILGPLFASAAAAFLPR